MTPGQGKLLLRTRVDEDEDKRKLRERGEKGRWIVLTRAVLNINRREGIYSWFEDEFCFISEANFSAFFHGDLTETTKGTCHDSQIFGFFFFNEGSSFDPI